MLECQPAREPPDKELVAVQATSEPNSNESSSIEDELCSTSSEKKMLAELVIEEPTLQATELGRYKSVLKTFLQCYLFNKRCERQKKNHKVRALTTSEIVKYLEDAGGEEFTPSRVQGQSMAIVLNWKNCPDKRTLAELRNYVKEMKQKVITKRKRQIEVRQKLASELAKELRKKIKDAQDSAPRSRNTVKDSKGLLRFKGRIWIPRPIWEETLDAIIELVYTRTGLVDEQLIHSISKVLYWSAERKELETYIEQAVEELLFTYVTEVEETNDEIDRCLVMKKS